MNNDRRENTGSAEKALLRSERLSNGLCLEFIDGSNRYYGDYHRVCVEVRLRLPLTVELFAGEAEPRAALERARRFLGEELLETRRLERMGVAGAEVAAVRDGLVEDFIRTGNDYFGRADFPARLLARSLSAARRPRGLRSLGS